MRANTVDQIPADAANATIEFLRLCLRSRWDPMAREAAQALAAREDADWDALLQVARRGGLAPLLYHATRDLGLLPPHVARELRHDYFGTAQANVRLFHELGHVLRRLAQDNVPAMLLKGAALAKAVYGNVAVRPMGDIDLLVRERDVPAALRALVAIGYSVIPPRAYRCEVMLQKREQALAPIELHWSLFVPFYHQHVSPNDWLWDTAHTIDVGNASVRILGPEAQLLHLCGHLTLHHGGGETVRKLWLYDVAALIDRYGGRLDWEEVLARAQACGLLLSLQRVLPRVSAVWRAPIPSDVLEQLDGLHPSPDEERALAALSASHRSPTRRLLSELAALPGYGSRFRFVWRNLFPPPGYLQQIYALPHPLLVPFAYLYRWLTALWSLLRH